MQRAFSIHSLGLRRPALVLAACLTVSNAPSTRAQTWTPTGVPSAEYLCVASSGDGTTLLAGQYQGPIYCTTNTGRIWSSVVPPLPPAWPSYFGSPAWHGLACSADGHTLAAVAFTGPIWISTNTGASWSYSGFYDDLQAVACSADGRKLVAVSDNVYLGPSPAPTNSGIYLSSDGGNTWTQANAPRLSWFSVASSADGGTLAVAGYAGVGSPVYVSTNSGITWNPAGVPNGYCHNVACSADGTKMMVGLGDSGGMFLSTNSGITWRSAAPTTANKWSVAASADGGTLAAAASSGSLYFSKDFGLSWSQSDAPITNWSSLAVSADGSAGVAATMNDQLVGLVYTFQTTPSPLLTLSRSAGNLIVSWVLPARGFVLQETADLFSSTWTNVAAPPVLNRTNLQQQVTLPTGSACKFYRLAGY